VTATDATPIAIVGVGKIARDQHVPAISGCRGFDLTATISRSGGIPGIENFAELTEFLGARPDVPAVSLCMPPQVRFAAAAAAIRAGRHVMLEKPPGATIAEVRALGQMAAAKGVTVFATWHSRHADGVAPAKAWLRDRKVTSARIDWKEDVRKWHPGQAWIWEPGGLGVFDPGINALSILTEILPAPVHLIRAELSFPENRAAPIAAALTFEGLDGLSVTAEFDWRQDGGEIWQISVDTADGRLDLDDGGARLTIDGASQTVDGPGEYPGLYARFAALIAAGESDVDDAPLVHVADAFMLGRRLTVAPFHD
jgi:D-galactose 1-dehydrogenase